MKLGLCASIAVLVVASGSARADSTAHTAAAQQAVASRAAELVAQPSRVKLGTAELYVPSFFQPVDGRYDLVVHFHGIPSLQEDNFERARVNAVVVSVNLGLASDAYSNAYRMPGSFDALLARADQALEQTGRAPGARLGRIALEAWSAGFAAVGAILKQPGVADRVDAVLLADGPHAMYAPSGDHAIYEPCIEKWVRLARAAEQGDKLFALTHSSIPTSGYPSTTETIGEILHLADVDKVARPGVGPRGMREIYESHRGSFHVAGYEGQTAKDHINHIKGMSETLLPYLRERWSSGY
jgi:hypothetical protein